MAGEEAGQTRQTQVYCKGLQGTVWPNPLSERSSNPTSSGASTGSRGRLEILSQSGPCSPPLLLTRPLGAVAVKSPVPVEAAIPEPGGGHRK